MSASIGAAASVEHEIALALVGRGCRPACPWTFVEAGIRHGVAPLLVRAGAAASLPPAAGERLRQQAREQAALAAVRDRELQRVLGGLHAACVTPLIFKGAHLAHAHYTCSYLRVRADTDLLISAADVAPAAGALEVLGYRRAETQTGGAVLGQMMFEHAELPGAVLDVHWRAAAPRLAARLLDLDDLLGRAVPLPSLGPHARGPSAADALAIACIHQVAHHPGEDVLLWQYDVHLLLHALDERELSSFAACAAAREMARICHTVIEHAATRFPSRRAEELCQQLIASADHEPSAALTGARSRLSDTLLDLRSEPAWRQRLALVAGHLFPPAAYMRTAYAPGSSAPLPVLYLRRILRGAPFWVGRDSRSRASRRMNPSIPNP